jgi:hypothetical protein
MASTVSANGLAVATSSSSHYAVTIADIRLVNRQVPTPLPNFIASEHIARGYPTTVLFDEGKVWNVPVEVGDPPKSNPVDTWPGAKSQAINSFASAAPGAGSPNVFVAGKKVLCFSHTTEQNARNSFGIITDKPGLDKLLKEYEDSLAKQKAKPDADSTSQSQGGGAGKAGQVAPPPPVPKPVPATTPPEQGCAISGVMAIESDRKQKRRHAADTDTLLEVIAGAKVDLEATLGTAMCGNHPAWSCAATGWTAKGQKTKFEVPGRQTAATGSLTWVSFFRTLPNVQATQYTVTVADHVGGEKFKRHILALPKATVSPFQADLGKFGEFGKYAQNVLKKTGLNFTWTVKVLNGQVSLEGGWNACEPGASVGGQPYDYKCYFAGAVKGAVDIIDGMARLDYSLLNLPIPAPPVQVVLKGIKAINAVTQALFDRDLVNAFVFAQIQGKLTTTLGLEFRKYYQGNFSLLPKATWDLTGTLVGSIGIRVAALESGKAGTSLASGTGSANLQVTASGYLLKNWPPGIQGKLTLNQPTLTLVLAYDLTVIIASPDEEARAHDSRGGWTKFWSGVVETIKDPWGAIKAGWSTLTAGVKAELIKSFGNSLKGSKTYTVGFGWDDIDFKTPEWRLPLG